MHIVETLVPLILIIGLGFLLSKVKFLGRDFAAVPGSRVHAALESGAMSYQSWCLRKAQA